MLKDKLRSCVILENSFINLPIYIFIATRSSKYTNALQKEIRFHQIEFHHVGPIRVGILAGYFQFGQKEVLERTY